MKNYALLLIIALISIPLVSSTTFTKTTEALTSKTYVAQQTDSKDSFSQELSVNWISESTIQYTLKINNESCASTFQGKAIATFDKEKNKESLTVVKHKKNSFLATLYIEKNNDFKVSIQIDSDDKSKAVVRFSTFLKDENEIECRSRNVVMLERN